MSRKSSARHGRARSLAPAAWPLRRKVVLAIAIPLLLAATLGGLRVRADLAESTNSSSSAQQVTVLRPAVAYLTAAERAMVAAHEVSAADLEAGLDDLQRSAKQLEAARDSADLTADQRYQVDAILDLSQAMREKDAHRLATGTWVAQVRQLQSGVTQLITTITNAQLDPEPRLELLAQTLGGRLSLAMEQALVATKRTGDTADQELFAELGAEGSAIDRLASALGDSEPAIATLRTDNAQRTNAVRTKKDDLGGPEAYKPYDTLTASLLDGIDDQLASSASDARTRAIVSAAITLGALLAAILLALLVSRLLLKPIRKVREGALDVANEQLPDAVARIRAGGEPGPIVPIDVTTQEEIGQLARAVDDMHRQAVHLASREADLRSQVGEMFVTLSRRNTSLVNQQLALIETLEKDEEDPRRLESLFRLDHLAARMRRTAESLLILTDAPTQAAVQDALSVTAALQAATAGVQDYQRVRIGAGSSATLSTTAAADVVHLLTELVDNALSYSSPTTSVSVGAAGSSDGVTVEVVDAGLGIPDDTLETINQTLRSGGEVTPETARRMGLFVVSRLAQRHGITVTLRRNHHGGTTAAVVLPHQILDAAPASAPASYTPSAIVSAAPTGSAPARQSVETFAGGSSGLPQRQPAVAVDTQLPVRRPAQTAPAAPHRPEVDQTPMRDETPADTPIFEALRSAWLSSQTDRASWRAGELEAGWSQADRVLAREQSQVSAAGLPVRRPGAHLLPGGVSKPTTAAARDPEAIRERLAAHAAGVSRGRRAATTSEPGREAGRP
jgi:signal transduction histidine kinase